VTLELKPSVSNQRSLKLNAEHLKMSKGKKDAGLPVLIAAEKGQS